MRDTALQWLADQRQAVVVEVTAAKGSVPRAVGTRMLVAAQHTAGTIGGGHLEMKAIASARAMLCTNELTPHTEHYPLGPALGQCCGGAVTLGYAALDAQALARWPTAAPRFRLQLFGAGHVGRAIARALAPLDVIVDWIDEREDEFPATFHTAGGDRRSNPGSDPGGDPRSDPQIDWPAHIRKVCVDAVEGEVRHAPPGAFYLVLTHRHDLDLRISEAILARGDFGFFGLIGSQTKRARFLHRFEQCGLDASRMTCPIGLPGIAGKEPEVIAASVVAQLLLASLGT